MHLGKNAQSCLAGEIFTASAYGSIFGLILSNAVMLAGSTHIKGDYYSSMQEFLPLEALTASFKTDIRKLELTGKHGSTALYSASTSFGDMTLIVEPHHPHLRPLNIRNALLAKQDLAAPLLYEQEVVKVREDYAVCLTLCEPLSLCRPGDLPMLRAESLFEGLVRCAYRAAKAGLAYEPECLRLERMLRSQHNSSFFMDFTGLIPAQDKEGQCFEAFKTALCQLMRGRSERMQEVLFICESPFVFNLDRIAKCESWFDLAMIFNLLQHEKVTVVSESRTKTLPVSKLSGPTRLEYQGVTYPPFLFRDGFRLDGITELTLEQLKTHFFEDGVIYYMTKQKYMCVRKHPSASEEEWSTRIACEDLIYVRPQVSKVEFINFLIAYFRFIEPLLHELTFHPDENALELAFTNKLGTMRRIVIKFHPKYVVKDEELSMIIEKSRLKNVALCLGRMAFGDSFLIFLANCDKMAQVRSFNISHCAKLTDSAINLMLASPFCKKLAVLRLDGQPLPELQVMKSRGQLKQLSINYCTLMEEGDVRLAELTIERLEALGVPIQLKLPETIRHLCLSQDVPLQQLRLLARLPLISLRVRLVESKKTMSSFFGAINSLYSKDNPVRIFSEGACRKTLKSIDISNSSVKLKDLKPIIALEGLETLICENMERDKFSDICLPHNIISLSLKGSRVGAQVVQELTQRINFFVRLSLLQTDVTDKTLETALKGKKYINWLEVGEEQLNLKFFSKKGSVEGLELHLLKMIRDDCEPALNALLFRQLTVCKELNLRCEARLEQRLVRKVYRFLTLYQEHLPNELNLNINSTPLIKLLPLRPRENSCESLTAVNNRACPHKVKLAARLLLAQQYRLPEVEEHLGINLFNVALHKIIQLHPDALLEVSIRSNRLLEPSAISLLRKYAGAKLLALDFRNCLFTYAEVQEELYCFPYLQSVNEGEYEISIQEDDNVEQELQKVLKFFMKLSLHEKMKLRLTAHSISQRELFFSILFEVLHHHSNHIVALDIDFTNIPPDNQGQPFWKKLFLLERLENLHIKYINDVPAGEAEETAIAIEFEQIINLNLFSLEIQTSIHLIIPMQLSFKDLRRLSLTYNEMDISEQVVARLLKSTPTLSHLSLKLQHCQHISSVGKISDTLQRMPNLTHLALNLESTSVKEASLFQLIDGLHKNTLLERFELNVNNCLLDINELVKICETLVDRVRFLHVLLFAMQARRPAFFRNHSDLIAMGIELIFTA